MDKTTHYVYSDELCHYGRKGMKWGQNIFGKKRSGAKGTVVAKKKKSYLERAKEAKEAKKKAKAAAAEEARKRDPKNMTDADLRRAIDRKRLENEYRTLYPKKVSWGKKFASEFLDKAITPSLVDGGKHILTNMLKQYGDNLLKKDSQPSEADILKKKLADLKLKNDYTNEQNRKEELKNGKYMKKN